MQGSSRPRVSGQPAGSGPGGDQHAPGPGGASIGVDAVAGPGAFQPQHAGAGPDEGAGADCLIAYCVRCRQGIDLAFPGAVQSALNGWVETRCQLQ